MTEPRSWIERRRRCVEKLEGAGFSVLDAPTNSYRLVAASYHTLLAPSYLQANCRCAKTLSSGCLDGSRIERLEMRQYFRPTCEQAFRGVISSSRLLYLFDHDVETDRLDEFPRAACFQQTLVEILR